MRRPWFICSWAAAPLCVLDGVTFCKIKPICDLHDWVITRG